MLEGKSRARLSLFSLSWCESQNSKNNQKRFLIGSVGRLVIWRFNFLPLGWALFLFYLMHKSAIFMRWFSFHGQFSSPFSRGLRARVRRFFKKDLFLETDLRPQTLVVIKSKCSLIPTPPLVKVGHYAPKEFFYAFL